MQYNSLCRHSVDERPVPGMDIQLKVLDRLRASTAKSKDWWEEWREPTERQEKKKKRSRGPWLWSEKCALASVQIDMMLTVSSSSCCMIIKSVNREKIKYALEMCVQNGNLKKMMMKNEKEQKKKKSKQTTWVT